jgi:hypothetical protein
MVADILKNIEISKEYLENLKEIALNTYNNDIKMQKINSKNIDKQVKDTEKKIAELDDKYIDKGTI